MPASTASPSDSALLIIDAQNEYRKGALAVTNAEASSKVISSLVEKYRAANGKIIHILHKTPEGAPIFTPNTELAEEFEELQPKVSLTSFLNNAFAVAHELSDKPLQDGEEIIWKEAPGSFEKTKLNDVLKSWGVNKIVLTGYMAHVCVSTTAREGFQNGYEVVVVEDAIGDRDIPGAKGEEVTDMVLKELADVFATIVKSSEVK
jgi:nicotinamidase-related amidase